MKRSAVFFSCENYQFAKAELFLFKRSAFTLQYLSFCEMVCKQLIYDRLPYCNFPLIIAVFFTPLACRRNGQVGFRVLQR
ncbi:hypothetical protein HMPREF3226_01246 [Prevotella corporis]|uniref:Uncharacterized protein n=1 Tax=Prevotella corporis TaxID=28128 RepID=A0A133Q949_9BACT|nr:hypothetical protein HMPREF3226_01246 [Prevotella corporis]